MERSGRLELERHGDKERPTTRAALVHILALKRKSPAVAAAAGGAMRDATTNANAWPCSGLVCSSFGFGLVSVVVHGFIHFLSIFIVSPPWTLT